MNKVDCEHVCMQAMAMADGYDSDLSSDQIEAHLADCADCRREVAQFRTLSSVLSTQKRLERTEDVWNRIEPRLPAASASESAARVPYPFILLGLLLLGYRLVEMIPDRHFGLLFKLVPVICVVAVFSYLRVNPFTINSKLRLAGE